MRTSARLLPILCVLLWPALAGAQDAATYLLTPAAAEKFAQALAPLPFVVDQWSGICTTAQRHLVE